MLNFFRNIRKSLLTENRYTKFLLYAVLEILIVIIGIMIAIQLDNWNEVRKSREMELKILKEIKLDLYVSLKELNNGLNLHRASLDRTIRLRDYLNPREHISENSGKVLGIDVRDHQFYPKTSGFEALKSVGFKTLTNDVLRKEITDIYQLEFQNIVAMGQDYSRVWNFSFLTPFIQEYEGFSDDGEYFHIGVADTIFIYGRTFINLEKMRKDRKLLWSIQESIRMRIDKLRNYGSVVGTTKDLIKFIDIELEKLEDK